MKFVLVDRGDNIVSKQNKDILSVFATDFNNQDIYSIDITNHISRYTNTSYNESYANVSPDGSKITFISDESGISNIYITEDKFLTSKNLTNVLTGITQLNWNSDSQIAFTGFYKSGYDVFILANIENEVKVPKAKWIKETSLDLLDVKKKD